MKKHIASILLAASVVFSMFTSPTPASADQPRMRHAIELLQEAKKSPRPLPLLKKALEAVQNAARNKGGRRFDAMPAIREAIDVAKDGGNPESKINHAIAMIHSGMDRAN